MKVKKKPNPGSSPSNAVELLPAAEIANAEAKVAAGNPHFVDSPETKPESSERTLYLKLDGDGNPLWSRMTPKTIETWEGIFKHPVTASQFSGQAVPPEQTGPRAPDVESLLGWMATGQAMLFSRMTGLPLEEAAQICALTEDDKALLAPRGARLLNKYGGSVLADYGDEIFFSLTYSMGMVRRYQTCALRAAEIRLEAAKIVPPPVEPDKEGKKSEAVLQ